MKNHEGNNMNFEDTLLSLIMGHLDELRKKLGVKEDHWEALANTTDAIMRDVADYKRACAFDDGARARLGAPPRSGMKKP